MAHMRKTRSGAALLIVLVVVMVITIIGLGFLTKSDSELACGNNMILQTRTSTDIAMSGLFYGRFYVLQYSKIYNTPEYVFSPIPRMTHPFKTGTREYYDLTIGNSVQSVTDPNDYYRTITVSAYRETADSTKVGETRITATLEHTFISSSDQTAQYTSIKRQ
ncbi:MAG: hypothetical protein JXA82_14525 [Sedimentisphaerales bacterium]|nr:hypothetical protein [Sedimentisphaerales bacterium]